MTIVADVVGLDPAKQVVTLKGPQHTVDLHIADPEQFKRIAKGDQVEATYTQALAWPSRRSSAERATSPRRAPSGARRRSSGQHGRTGMSDISGYPRTETLRTGSR